MNLPRGIRNNNPGNIERNNTPWRGLCADQSGDPRFCIFEAPEFGLRAIARILLTYYNIHGLNTVRGIIDRWAPPSENNTDVYVHAVAARLGVRTDARIDVSQREVMTQLIRAITAHENGNAYVDYYDAATIGRGLSLAGIMA